MGSSGVMDPMLLFPTDFPQNLIPGRYIPVPGLLSVFLKKTVFGSSLEQDAD